MILRTACIFKTAEQNLGRDRFADNDLLTMRALEHGVAQAECYFCSFFAATFLNEDHILLKDS